MSKFDYPVPFQEKATRFFSVSSLIITLINGDGAERTSFLPHRTAAVPQHNALVLLTRPQNRTPKKLIRFA
jgi:hypothetical protein